MGIAGWSDPDLTVRDNGVIDSERRKRGWQGRSLGGSDLADDEDIENHNVQIIKLISALGNKDRGRRAILKAMADKYGLLSDHDIDQLLEASPDRKIQVPAYMRNIRTTRTGRGVPIVLRGVAKSFGISHASPARAVVYRQCCRLLLHRRQW